MRTREKNLWFPRVRFEVREANTHEKNYGTALCISIPTGSQEAWAGFPIGRSTFDDVSYTRLSLKEQKQLLRFLQRVVRKQERVVK